MPIIAITLVEGRDEEKITRCMKAVARTVAETLEAPLDTVRVAVHEVPPARFARGDQLKSEA